MRSQRTGGGGRLAAASYFVCALYLHFVASLLTWTVIPTVAGLTPTVIVSDSMSPRISSGDIVLTRGTSGRHLEAGDVVTFDDTVLDGRLVTHRIVERLDDGTYRTQGDASWGADADPVAPSRIRGVGRFVIPAVGLPLTWTRGGAWHTLALWVAGTLLAVAYLRADRAVAAGPFPTWSTSLSDAPPVPPPVSRRRGPILPRLRMAATGSVAVLAVVGLSSPHVAASDAAFTADTTNDANTVEASTSFCTPRTETVTATADVRIVSGGTTNLGAEPTLGVTNKGGNQARSLVDFDIPNPGSCNISAQLRLLVTTGATGRTLHALAVSEPWSETAVLWDTQPPTTGTPSAAASATSGWIAFDVTDQVAAMVAGTAHGFRVMDSTEGGAGPAVTQTFSSREGADPPQLVLNFTEDPPPAAPSALAATPQSSTRVDLTWTDNATTESGYEIEVSAAGAGAFQAAGSAPASATTFTVTGQQPETAYDFRVRAWGTGGYSSWSNVASATTPPAPPPPSAPTDLTATAAGVDRIDLSWTDTAADEDGFVVERSPAGAATWAVVATLGPDTTAHPDTGLQAGTAYDYRVRAYNGGGDSAWSGIATATTDGCATLPAQTLTSLADTLVLQGSTTEFGNTTYFGVRAQLGGSGRSLVRFGTPVLAGGCAVTGATLRLYVSSAPSPLDLQAHAISGSWTELGMTWTNQPATSALLDTITSGAVAGWREWNVTSAVGPDGAGAPNGFLVRDSLENQGTAVDHMMSPREGTDTPQLVVRFD